MSPRYVVPLYLLFANQPTGARIDAMQHVSGERARAITGRIRAASYQTQVVRAPADSYCAHCAMRDWAPLARRRLLNFCLRAVWVAGDHSLVCLLGR